MSESLEEKGTPWAEVYRGSGRYTGRLSTTPVCCENGDVAPGWDWVGDLTKTEFYGEFEQEQHDHCHSPSYSDYNCPYCVEARWVKSREEENDA